jgi:hypothetical protein
VAKKEEEKKRKKTIVHLAGIFREENINFRTNFIKYMVTVYKLTRQNMFELVHI